MMSIRFAFRFTVALAMMILVLLSPQISVAEDGLNAAQRSEVEALIKDYLRENPEVLVEAIQALRDKQEMASRNQVQSAVMDFKLRLAHDLNPPTMGPVNASVTVVEFFDYRCGYCKRVLPDLVTLLEGDDDIRVVFMEFPILGDESVAASRAALAVWLNWPDRYVDVHNALMGSRGNLTLDKVLEIIAETGIDAKAVRDAMDSEKIDSLIEENYGLAKSMDINGTPAFIIGDELVPGAISLDAMKQLVAAARAN